MRMILSVCAVLMMSAAADARCLARLSEPLVFTKSHCEECGELVGSLRELGLKPRVCNIFTDADCEQLFEAHAYGKDIPITFVCNEAIVGNSPQAVMNQIEKEKTEIHPDDYDYGDWD